MLRGVPRWIWLTAAAFVCGLVPVVLAFTARNRGTPDDPAGLFHHYTLVQTAGPGILALIAAPALISLLVLVLAHLRKSTRVRHLDRVAWALVVLSCIAGLAGTFAEGLSMLLAPALTVWAVTAAPSFA